MARLLHIVPSRMVANGARPTTKPGTAIDGNYGGETRFGYSAHGDANTAVARPDDKLAALNASRAKAGFGQAPVQLAGSVKMLKRNPHRRRWKRGMPEMRRTHRQ